MSAVQQLAPRVGRSAACRALSVPRASWYRSLPPTASLATPVARPTPARALQTPLARTLTDNCCKLLAPREQAVVQLVADGLSNREIATELKLSQHTVKNYLFRVFDKIGVSSRVELVLCALTSSMADPTVAPHRDKTHPVTVGVRRRPESMTNA